MVTACFRDIKGHSQLGLSALAFGVATELMSTTRDHLEAAVLGPVLLACFVLLLACFVLVLAFRWLAAAA